MKKMMTYLMLLSLVNLMIGCTTTKNIALEEALPKVSRENPDITKSHGVVAIDIASLKADDSSEIVGVRLKSGETVRFSDAGGVFDRNAGIVNGVDLNGEEKSFSVVALEFVLVERSLQEFSSYQSKTIIGATVQTGKRFEFIPKTVRFDNEAEVVTGLLKNGERFEIRYADIRLLRERQSNTQMSTIVGGVLLVSIIMLYMVAESMDHMFDEWNSSNY